MFGVCVFVGVRTELNANVTGGGGVAVVGITLPEFPRLSFCVSEYGGCREPPGQAALWSPPARQLPAATDRPVSFLCAFFARSDMFLCVLCKVAWSCFTLVVTWCSQGRGKGHYTSRDLVGVLTPPHSVVYASPRDHVHPSTPPSVVTALYSLPFSVIGGSCVVNATAGVHISTSRPEKENNRPVWSAAVIPHLVSGRPVFLQPVIIRQSFKVR